MRGELGKLLISLNHCRITPAYAGRTGRKPDARTASRDHPRVCGENGADRCLPVRLLGSPPRMRGEPQGRLAAGMQSGITPAYAGRTRPRRAICSSHGDHPRVCGENQVFVRLDETGMGSPPRMRGERSIGSAGSVLIRITPAYAGRTGEWAFIGRHSTDHPRVCGENPDARLDSGFDDGSPPRMRGEPIIGLIGIFNLRITPAYAGRTDDKRLDRRRDRDHPRVCGENLFGDGGEFVPAGSPPRMRGEHAGGGWTSRRRRITPAYAGRTVPIVAFQFGFWDHPRVCGENLLSRLRVPSMRGSPPRMRGELVVRHYQCRP